MANAPVDTLGIATVYTARGAMPMRAAFFAANSSAPASAPPSVANVVVPTAPDGHAQFDVLDDSGLFRAIICLVSYRGDLLPTDVVHVDIGSLSSFSPPYIGTRTPITGGFRYVVQRSDGWPTGDAGHAHFYAVPIDQGGAIG